MRGYILLICTWLLIAASIIYLWVRNGLEPPVALWVILIFVALVPLAGRLKIANLIDFTKKVEKLGNEVTSVKREVSTLTNRVDMFISSVQSQQQFNVSLVNEKAARSFADVIARKSKANYPPSSLRSVGEEGEGDVFLPKKVNKKEELRLFFLEAADQAISAVSPIIRILYSAKLAKQEGKMPEAKQVLDKSIESATQELLRDNAVLFGTTGNLAEQTKRHFQAIIRLISFRQDVYQNRSESPTIADGRKMLEDADYAAGYLLGAVSSLVDVFFTSDAIMRNGQLIAFRPGVGSKDAYTDFK
jgi:hypothetical protein